MRFFFGILLLLFSIRVIAQPACADNPAAADFCANATPICNLNGYCGNTSESYTNKVSSTNSSSENNTPLGDVFCATIQNNSWVKFIANASTAVFNVWVSDCAINRGIQMRIYHTTDCYNFTPVSNCWNPLTPTNGQITATGLTPGEVYYFMIDGTQGDVCDYVISASSGVTTTPEVSGTQHICAGQSAAITVTGGDEYVWTASPSDPTLSGQTNNSTINVTPSVTTTYHVMIEKDGNNSFCQDDNYELSTTVIVNAMPELEFVVTPEHCHNEDGIISVLINNNPGPFTYYWDTGPAQNTQTISGLSEGNYAVSVSDNYGCSGISETTVTNINYLTPVIVTTTTLCNGRTAVLDAGSGFSSYIWSTGSTSQTITSGLAGLFSVTVTANNNCIGSDSIMLNVVIPVPEFSGDMFICPSDSTTIQADNDFASYLWSTGETTSSITTNQAQTYSLTVTDSNGCTGESEVNIVYNDGPYTFMKAFDEMCYRSNGYATVWVSGGQGTYTYLWDNESTDTISEGLAAGTHYVTVSDGNCQVTDSVIVYMFYGAEADFGIYQDELVLIDESVIAEFYDNSSGDVINWHWDFGDGSYVDYVSAPGHDYENSGTYNVTEVIEDIYGCTDTTVKPIKIRDYFTVYIPNCFIPYGNDVNSYFYPIGQGWDSEDFEMYIYDRWGNTVFQSTDIANIKWNGTHQNEGQLDDMTNSVYIYLIRIKEEDGILHEYRGSVTLLK